MKLEKEAIIEKTLTELKTDKNDYPFHIELKMMLNEKERQLVKKHFGDRNVKLTLKYQDPILDEVERKYLSGVIRPFRDIVKGISKMKSVSKENMEYILITLADNECSYMAFPYFKKEKMYKNMKLNKRYTLEELEL